MSTTTNYALEKPNFNLRGWHDDINNNFDIIDAALSSFGGTTGIVGIWQNSIAYTVGQRVVDDTDSTVWQCAVANTSASSGTFSADRTANPTYWTEVTSSIVNRGAWTTATLYNAGEFVSDSNRFGIVVGTYTSGASYNADVSNGDIDTLLDLSAYTPITDSDDVSEGSTNLYVTAAQEAKIDYLTVTGNVDLDAINTKLGYLTVTQAVDLDTLESDFAALVSGVSASYDTLAEIETALGNKEDADADILKADTADVLTAGFASTAYDAGTKSTGTFTPDEASGNFQYAVNGGAHTLAPPSNNCSIVLHYTNNGSAGAITTSGFTLVDGDSFDTTDTNEFICYITKVNDVSHLTVKALQ